MKIRTIVDKLNETKFRNGLRLTSIVSYIVLVLTLAVATFVEYAQGTEFVANYVYGSFPFALLLGIVGCAAVISSILLLRNKPFAMCVHLAIAVILLGGLITKLTGVVGAIHLRQNVRNDMFVSSTGEKMYLPFGLKLVDFSVQNYPGTDFPMDYCSRLVTDKRDTVIVSMNRIYNCQGYRFYQASYDADGHGSILSINYDPFGIAFSYCGYAFMLIAFLLVIINPQGNYVKILKRLSSVCIIGAMLTSCSGYDGPLPQSPTQEECDAYNEVLMLYDGRMVPINTYATDFCLKLTGATSYRGLSAMQVLLGWLFYPQDWQYEPMIKVKGDLPEDANIPKLFGRVYVNSLFEEDKTYKLARYLRDVPSQSVVSLNDQMQLIVKLTTHSALKVFPVPYRDKEIHWVAPSDRLPQMLSADEQRFIEECPSMMKKALDAHDIELLRLICSKITAMQQRYAADVLPSHARVRAEIIYCNSDITTILARAALTLGLIAMLLSIVSIVSYRYRHVNRFNLLVLIVLCCLQAISIALRWYISGQIPISTGYETMLILALFIMIVAILARRLTAIMVPAGILLSGFALLVASIGLHQPNITPLMPVLHSPWLSLHVCSVMIAYALLAIVSINSAVALIDVNSQRRMVEVSLTLLYPALFMLSLGIWVGAVWANESWGRYWSWDPKEVWALITLLVYVVPLHKGIVPAIGNPRNTHIYLLVAFATVLMTYFGVNLLLGGMHSYGAQ